MQTLGFPRQAGLKGKKHMAKKKKKMTPAQAAAARRPYDWEPPQKYLKPKKTNSSATSNDSIASKSNRKMWLILVAVFVVAAIVAPFIAIYVSQMLGIQ